MKGEEWRNAWPETFELARELQEMGHDMPYSFVNMLRCRCPVNKVAAALRGARTAKEPVPYIMGILKRELS